MKALQTFSLIVALGVQMFSASLILLNYEVNTAYIIENFCENKDKPELKCNGKCHLSKQIEQDAEKKSETPATLTELPSLVLTIQEIPVFHFELLDNLKLQHSTFYLEADYSSVLPSVFHPPKV